MQLSDLKPGVPFDVILGLIDVNVAPFTSRPGQHLRATAMDGNGTIPAVMWDDVASSLKITDITSNSVYRIHGSLGNYKGAPQLQIVSIALPTAEDEADVATLLPGGPLSADELRDQLLTLLNGLEYDHPDLMNLITTIWSLDARSQRVPWAQPGDTVFDCMLQATAASKHHHAYRGGLAVHTLEVARTVIAAASTPTWNSLNGGLLTAGALLHDVGKIWEYDSSKIGFPRYPETSMTGGHFMVARDLIIAHSAGVDPDTTQKLIHMILSHHGRLDWGAMVLPATSEAVLLAHADLLSARLTQAIAGSYNPNGI